MVAVKETPAQRHDRMLLMERETWAGGALVAGLDEVGVGPIAGPVVAGCVILDPQHTDELLGVNDSKALSAPRRAELEQKIYKHALAVCIGKIEAADVDKINSYYAGIEAMKIAFNSLQDSYKERLGVILIDGPLRKVDSDTEQWNVIKGDSKSLSIAAASIVAKEYRDRIMEEYAKQYPQYGFEHHKGYFTHYHAQALREHGPCPIHRMSYAPVKSILGVTDAEHQADDAAL